MCSTCAQVFQIWSDHVTALSCTFMLFLIIKISEIGNTTLCMKWYYPSALVLSLFIIAENIACALCMLLIMAFGWCICCLRCCPDDHVLQFCENFPLNDCSVMDFIIDKKKASTVHSDISIVCDSSCLFELHVSPHFISNPMVILN